MEYTHLRNARFVAKLSEEAKSWATMVDKEAKLQAIQMLESGKVHHH